MRGTPVEILAYVRIIVQVGAVTSIPIVIAPVTVIETLVIETKLEPVTMMMVVVIDHYPTTSYNWLHMMWPVMMLVIPVRWIARPCVMVVMMLVLLTIRYILACQTASK
jgi:hypothetical protein